MTTTITLLFTILFGVQLTAKAANDNGSIPTMETGVRRCLMYT